MANTSGRTRKSLIGKNNNEANIIKTKSLVGRSDSYRNPFGILLPDFLALRLPFLENIVFFVLELHCVDGKRRTASTDTRANERETTQKTQYDWRSGERERLLSSSSKRAVDTNHNSDNGSKVGWRRRRAGFVVFVGHGRAGCGRQLTDDRTNRGAVDGRPQSTTAAGHCDHRPQDSWTHFQASSHGLWFKLQMESVSSTDNATDVPS